MLPRPRRSIYVATGPYEPFVPPNPYKLPKPKPPRGADGPPSKWSRRLRRLLRLTLYAALLSLTTYILDIYYNAASLVRSLRTLRTALLITADYKINFSSHKTSSQLSSLHSRNADRIVHLCLMNGGLYQKIGQAIAMQSALLPAEFQRKFARFFDDTPVVPEEEILRVLRADWGCQDPVADMFVPGTWQGKARGSASVAQVHKAQLKEGGEWVAIKVQKPGIETQVKWDLAVFRLVMGWLGEGVFGLPLGWAVEEICDRLGGETDFRIEKENAKKLRRLIEMELNGGRIPRRRWWRFWGGEGSEEVRVYVPEVYDDYCTKRVMVAEWIDGIPLSEGRKVKAKASGIRGVGEPGVPENGLRKHGFDEGTVMYGLLSLFAKMMFWWGHVHCDPHPGNILIRRVPAESNSFTREGGPTAGIERERTVTEVVLLDHGLYVHLSPLVRQQYARLWTALMSFDTETVTEITTKWGFGNPDMVASMTMLRPWRGSVGVDLKNRGGAGGARGAGVDEEDVERELTPYEQHVRVKEALGKALEREEEVPKELVFLGRCMRILQADNQLLSSPINRLALLSRSASARARQVVRRVAGMLVGIEGGWGKAEGGFEEEVEERMKRLMKEEWGMEVGGGMFEG
ncbi:ABC1 family-domain-containing protein [Kalaharituber pfeilii]|nr:ABC1 family-domain-containing protein [Kalaharituber pfeilii]